MSKKANAIQKTNKMMMEDHRMRDYEAVKTKLGEAGEDAEFLELIFQACQYCYMMEMLEGDHVIPFKEWLTDDVMETVMEAFMVCAAYRETENETIFDEAFKEYDFESEEDCMKLLEALEEDNGCLLYTSEC